MDGLLRGLESGIIIFSETWEDRIKHVREVLERLRKGKLKTKIISVDLECRRAISFDMWWEMVT